jgi:hypothetical protein
MDAHLVVAGGKIGVGELLEQSPRRSLTLGLPARAALSATDEPKRIRECRSLFLFSNAGEQTNGVSGEAYIEGCAIVSRSN